MLEELTELVVAATDAFGAVPRRECFVEEVVVLANAVHEEEQVLPRGGARARSLKIAEQRVSKCRPTRARTGVAAPSVVRARARTDRARATVTAPSRLVRARTSTSRDRRCWR